MILGEDEPLLQPVETVEFPFVFNGSYLRKLGRNDGNEPFTVYRFEYPDMIVRINQARRNSYGKADSYFGGEVTNPFSLSNHYAEFYGGDTGLVHFWTDQPEKENILIVSNSYSNAVNMLIASHFNHTLVVDPREFENLFGQDLTVPDLMRDYEVTRILLLGDPTFFKWQGE